MATPSPSTGIRKIEISNFRQIDHLVLDFVGPKSQELSNIAVLAGPNGCGKTSVLEACLIALGYEGQYQGAKDASAKRHGATSWEIRAQVLFPLQGIVTLTQNSNGDRVWEKDGKNIEPLNAPFPCLYFNSWRTPKLVGSLPITAGKPGKRAKDTAPNRVWRAKQHLINSKAHSLMSQNSHKQPTFNDYGIPGFESELDKLNEAWKTFYPDRNDTFVVEPVSNEPNDGFDVFIESTDGSKISVDRLSSGQLELFSFFGGLLLAGFQSGVIVIDEPELHLDPQWHVLLLKAIRQFVPMVQLIVATHSPKIVESVLSFQRHYLIPDNDPRSSEWKNPSQRAVAV